MPFAGRLAALVGGTARLGGTCVGPDLRAAPVDHPGRIVVQVALEQLHACLVHQPELIGGGAQKVAVVRHDDQGALEGGKRHGQRFARRHVQMIGRFVHHQQVRTAPSEQGQRTSGPFPTRQPPDRSACQLRTEAEAAEEIAQLLLARVRGDPAQQLQRTLGRIQIFELMLCEVADHRAR